MTTPAITTNPNVTHRRTFVDPGPVWDYPAIDRDDQYVYIKRHLPITAADVHLRTDPLLRIDGTPAEVADWLNALARAIRRQRNLGTCPRCGRTVDPSAAGVWESADGSCDGCRAKEAG